MSGSDKAEHLSSVHKNPFVLEFGLDAVLRHENRDATEGTAPTSEPVAERDEQEEYHVNSGFVNKLRSKFARLENKSNVVTLSKRSASVENLLSLDSATKNDMINARHNSSDDTDLKLPVTKVDMRNFTPSGYKPATRPHSSELILSSRSSEKPPLPKAKGVDFLRQNYSVRSVKPPLPKKSSDGARIGKRSSSDNSKVKVEHHDWTVAPDVEGIGRENIVIIESHAPSSTPETEQITISENLQNDTRQVKPMKEKRKDENELPKPNTVSAFRSLFENTKKASDTLHVWRHNSPGRRSSGSDTNSPASTPRSPLIKMNDDNVFESTANAKVEKDINVNYSPRNSWNKEESKSTRRSSSEFVPDIDTTPTSIKKSRELFQKSSSNKDSENKSIAENDTEASVVNVQTTLTPVHPLSNVFDSKSVAKSDKARKPKPAAAPRQKPVPKDTIELKHEHDKLVQDSKNISETDPGMERLKSSFFQKDVEIVSENNIDFTDSKALDINSVDTRTETVFQRIENEFNFNDGISKELSVQPSKKTSGKISPRKTKIFDSSNMVKRKKDPPKLKSPTVKIEESAKLQSNDISNNVPSVDSRTNNETSKEVPLVKRSENKVKRNAPDPPIQTDKFVKTKTAQDNTSNGTQINNDNKFKVKEPNFPKPVIADKTKNDFIVPKASNNGDAPVSAMSSFLANRLKKNQTDQENQRLDTSSPVLNGSSSPVPQKKQVPEMPETNGSSAGISDQNKNKTTAPPLPVTPQPSLPKSNIDDIIKRKKGTPQSSGKMVFDSSKIANKRKDAPKRNLKPPRKTVAELNKDLKVDSVSVPKLDLTCITDTQQTEYQEGYIPTVIKPCPYKFVNAEVVFAVSPMKKRKRNKKPIKARFDDHATTTFEYEGEDVALETYLRDHPEEIEEARKQELEDDADGAANESKVLHWLNDTSQDNGVANNTSAHLDDGHTMKSNTVIGVDTGALTNYKSKMQIPDFQFGVTPDPVEEYRDLDLEAQRDPDSMQLVPADDNELDAFSAEISSSDLMF